MPTKKDYQQGVKDWKAFSRAVIKYVKKLEKDTKALPAGEVITNDAPPGGDRPPTPKFP
jgi:hypothetical protein